MKMYQAHWLTPAPIVGFHNMTGNWFWTKKEATDDAKKSSEFVKMKYWLVTTCHKDDWQKTILNLMNGKAGVGTTKRINNKGAK
jgi:hypothetical protein|tara:strand:- start:1204 stop:1455 length:252 start_codon:yes stop_codon:yes gene_type:complete